MPSVLRAKQERLTYLDTILYQKRMLMFINGKLAGKPYFVSKKEQYDFYELASYCFLSQGSFVNIIPSIQLNGMKVPLGKDIHHFCNLLNFGVTREKTTLKFQGKEIEVPSVELWKVLLKYCLEIFHRAQAEALKMSKEIPKSEARSLGFEFSADKKLGEE